MLSTKFQNPVVFFFGIIFLPISFDLLLGTAVFLLTWQGTMLQQNLKSKFVFPSIYLSYKNLIPSMKQTSFLLFLLSHFPLSMAPLRSHLLLFFILFASLSSCLQSRKLPLGPHKPTTTVHPSLFFASLPKGTVPSSTPSRKGHSTVVDEKLIARQLITTDRLLLQSVPSPGAGH